MQNGSLNVLIVEDRRDEAERMVRELKTLNQPLEWRLASDEHDYRNQLLWPPHVIVADYKLPRFDACRALAILQQNHLDIPLIVVTTGAGEQGAVDCLKRGAVDFLLKDRLNCLPAAITSAVEEHRLRQEKRRTEDRLRDREERLRLALEAAGMATWDWNLQSNFLSASEHAGPLFGMARGAFFETIDNFYAAIHADDRDAVRAAIDAASNEAGEYTVEFRVADESASARWILSQGRVERDHAGSPARMLGVLLDITQRVGAAQETSHRLADLANVTRLTTTDSLVAEIAHELNQPLYAIANFSQACINSIRQGNTAAASPDLVTWLEQIVAQSQRAGEIIRRAYSFVRRAPPQKHIADANRLIRESASLLQPNLRHDEVRLELKLANKLQPVIVDEVQIQQVLINLVTNAIDAMRALPPNQRQLVVESRQTKAEEIEVAVHDHGAPVPNDVAKNLEKLFEPFYTTKPGGMGLGLAISRSIVEAHGGRLTAEQNPATGLTFRFTIPSQ